MIPYQKINSIYKRDPITNRFIIGDYSSAEFCYLSDLNWLWTEKIDGTNIRIGIDEEYKFHIKGRTDNASIPVFLLEAINKLGLEEKLRTTFDGPVCLYGEGYGRKIQKVGSLYIPDGNSFILFDVRVGHTWLTYESVEDIANKFGIKFASAIKYGTIQEAIEYVKGCPKSFEGNAPMEGLVLRTDPILLDGQGHRIITKIKVRDFV